MFTKSAVSYCLTFTQHNVCSKHMAIWLLSFARCPNMHSDLKLHKVIQKQFLLFPTWKIRTPVSYVLTWRHLVAWLRLLCVVRPNENRSSLSVAFCRPVLLEDSLFPRPSRSNASSPTLRHRTSLVFCEAGGQANEQRQDQMESHG